MCGIVGVAGTLEFKDEKLIKNLLLVDYLRGPDSTGLAAVKNDGSVKMAKAAVNPLDLFDMQRFKDCMSGFNTAAYIGHNRAATRGVVNNVNAHPYHIGKIVGVHNGTLDLTSYAELERELGEKYPTDSMAIIAAIDRFGIEKTVKMLQGAWSLVWFNLEEGTINFLRNKERPMWLAYTEDFKKLLWASEYPMIDFCAETGGYSLYTQPDKGYKFWATDIDVCLSFDITKIKAGSDKMIKPVARKMEGKPPAPKQENFSWNRDGNTGFHNSYSKTPSQHSKKEESVKNVVTLFGNVSDPYAGAISKEDFDRLAKYGCSWCGVDVEYGDVGVTILDAHDVVLCSDCSAHTSTRIYTENDKLFSNNG